MHELLEIKEIIAIHEKRRDSLNEYLGDLESASERFKDENLLKAIEQGHKEYKFSASTVMHLTRYFNTLSDFVEELKRPKEHGRD